MKPLGWTDQAKTGQEEDEDEYSKSEAALKLEILNLHFNV